MATANVPGHHDSSPRWQLRISIARPLMPPRDGVGAYARIVGGPVNLLAWFESQLGLHDQADASTRLAAACTALQRAITAGHVATNLKKGFRRHPYAVASRIISHRDSFLMAVPLVTAGAAPSLLDIDHYGANPPPVSLPDIVRQYIAMLASATAAERAQIATGEPDRLQAVHAALLGGQRLPSCSILIDDDRAEWSARWQSLLTYVHESCATIDVTWQPVLPPPRAPDASALHAAQVALAPDFNSPAAPSIVADDTLRVARCASAAVAAQAAANALQGLSADERAACVVICPDNTTAAMIDAHLHAFGLPTMGIATGSSTSDILAVLPLAIEAVGNPPDPRRVKELLALPCSPVDRGAGKKLLKALDDLPAVGSPPWKTVVRQIRLTWKYGRRRAAKINTWFPAPQRWCRSRIVFEATALAAAVNRVSTWATRNALHLKEEVRTSLEHGVRTPADSAALDLVVARQSHFQALATRCRSMLSLMAQRNLAGVVDRATVTQLLDAVNGGQVATALHPDSTGGPRRVRSLAEVGDFIGDVRRAIWVGPVRQEPPQTCWSAGDLALMKSAHSIDLDMTTRQLDAVTRAEESGMRHLSGSFLVIAHPSVDPALRPHSLWLLITEMVRNGQPPPLPNVYRPELIDSSVQPFSLAPWSIARSPQPREREPAWITSIRLDPSASMPRRRTVSHSDVARRLACPVSWAFNYAANLSRPTDAAMKNAAISRGTVGEHVLREVFEGTRHQSLADAQARLDHVLRKRLPRLHAQLCDPAARADRLEFEAALRETIPVLQALVDAGITFTFGARFDTFKNPANAAIKWQGQCPTGAIDILGLAASNGARVPLVIDVKYASRDLHKASLKNGSCTQLILYSDFVQRCDPSAPVNGIGYLVIRDGCLYVPQWAAGILANPGLARVVQLVGKPTDPSLAQRISNVDAEVHAVTTAMHQPGAVLEAHPRVAAAGGTVVPGLTLLHGTNPTKAAEAACKYCEYSLFCGKDRVR